MSLFSSSKSSIKSAKENSVKEKSAKENSTEIQVADSTSDQTPEVEEKLSSAKETSEVVQARADTNATDEFHVEATNCETSAHLMQYPVIKTTVELIEEIPGVKLVVDSTQQVGEFMHSQYLLKPVIQTLDSTGKATLNAVDSVAPCLQTTDFETIGKVVQEPLVQANTAIKGATDYVQNTVDYTILAPAANFAHNAREYINTNIYDTKSKPLLRGSIDPIVRPFNNAIESFTEKYFPECEPVSKDFKTEWDRKIPLEINLIKRVIPATASAATNLALAPYHYGSHVVDVIQENLKKDEKKSVLSSLQAVYLSKAELTSEIWDHTVGTSYNYVFGKNAGNDVEPGVDTVPTEATADLEDVQVAVLN